VILIGLTGGIGSGKTAVARMLAARGAVVVDADELARRAIDRGTPGHARVMERFDVGGPDGAIDRERLARIVFEDPVARADLEAIVHPEVARLFVASVAPYRDTDAVVVYDVPLLVEADLAGLFDAVVVVTAPEAVRVARLVGRGLTPDAARARIRAQATDDDRELLATEVLRNDGTMEDLERQVDGLWARIA
jgi:dephospho-CoA kinase